MTKHDAERKVRILDFIAATLRARGYPPSVREIAVEAGIAHATAAKVVAHLKAEGYVTTSTGAAGGTVVAARAQSHLLIEKQAIEEGAFVRTHVRRLDGKARQEEVARMLAGAKVTDEARAAAGKLISEVS